MKYVQCSLQRENTHLVSWIPKKFAVPSKILKLKNNNVWEDGWKVISIGTELDETLVPDSHKGIKNHWKNTSGPVVVGHK